MIAQTTMEAYYSIQSELNSRQLMVFNFIRDHPGLNAEQIYIGMGYRSPNSTSPRITELLEEGLIEVAGYNQTSSGRRARTYRVREVA
ncbi:MAG: hypothetical protein IJT54_05160 [Candidatus Methanomethylophilaceae archaeon]|nr:hypothetical protein [Candidatus Methanomethylophilaceae archaeon]